MNILPGCLLKGVVSVKPVQPGKKEIITKKPSEAVKQHCTLIVAYNPRWEGGAVNKLPQGDRVGTGIVLIADEEPLPVTDSLLVAPLLSVEVVCRIAREGFRPVSKGGVDKDGVPPPVVDELVSQRGVGDEGEAYNG